MASYEDYDTTSANYDTHRRPLGVGVIVSALEASGIPLATSRVLDAGCGTGAYLAELASITSVLEGVERSKGMLDQARAKLASRANIRLVEGSILALPFEDRRFDAAIVNQVVHHLDGDDPAFPNLRVALRELHRVLRDAGVLVIGTCSQTQVFEGAWYTCLIPEATARLAQRYAPIPALRAMLTDVGFEVCDEIVPLGERFAGPHYLDPSGPLEKAWRDSDSLWALATPTELDRALTELREHVARGDADAFVRARDEAQQPLGQATFVVARRR